MEMCKKTWKKIKSKAPAFCSALKELLVWLFASFLLPLVQLFFIKCSNKPTIVDESVYGIIFVTIASFLTGVFFTTNFWRQNRIIVRVLLVLSYIIAFGLFVVSLIQIMFGVDILKLTYYQWGMYIALTFAVVVGFCCKYDDKMAEPLKILEQGKNKRQSEINGKEVKL